MYVLTILTSSTGSQVVEISLQIGVEIAAIIVAALGTAAGILYSFFHNRARRNSAHYQRLIEDSIQYWEYYPQASGEMIQGRVAIQNAVSFDGQSYGLSQPSDNIPYLQQAKDHVKAYDFWNLYEQGHTLAADRDQKRSNTTSLIRAKLELGLANLTVANKQMVVDSFLNSIFTKLPPELIPGSYIHTYTAANDSGIWRVDGLEIQGTPEVAQEAAAVLTSVKSDNEVRDSCKTFLAAHRAVDENVRKFNEKLRMEVIEQVRVSMYTKMKGKCNVGY